MPWAVDQICPRTRRTRISRSGLAHCEYWHTPAESDACGQRVRITSQHYVLAFEVGVQVAVVGRPLDEARFCLEVGDMRLLRSCWD